ncbi:sugar-binding transcriptional regulator [Ornithinimicrobium pekingense]|uniref:DeoR family transcriptional regulator n=1 Tax=Ornithinimicrobium pekingense TaxID=384677 RepID=A0ABQ2F4N7_9MICO|nr:sugar-binding domain-containing protein [Ornithinimicrobium pekingense]GGK60783.1 DeoR family transcriptional regulator [Ornithinimicrobium pekingense]
MGREDVLDQAERRTAAAVARRYYLDGESKVDIAADLGLSRFKVARLLDQAKRSGMVRIEVVEPVDDAVLELAAQVRDRWGLRECWVVPDSDAPQQDVGRAAGELLGRLLGPQDVLGMPWSRSGHAMVDALTTLPRVPVVQLSGAAATTPVDSSTVDIVRRASRIAGGGRQVFFAPLVMPDAEAAEAVRRDVAVRDTLGAASTVTVAMVGVGAWAPGESTIHDLVDDAAREKVAAAGAVGEIAGVFFDDRGRLVQTSVSRRVIALSGEQLSAIPTVLASCHQPARAPALAAAVRGGLVTALVVTAEVAEALLELSP